MPTIMPVSDLTNYNAVLKNVTVGNPVYLTKNGRGMFVIYDINDIDERAQAAKRFFAEIEKGEKSELLSIDRAEKIMGL
jgi:hypothetical protein